jgi:hypothetical protein
MAATALLPKDEPFVSPLSAVLANLLVPDPGASIELGQLHRIVRAAMYARHGHGVPIGTLKRVLRATGVAVRAKSFGTDAYVYGVAIKPSHRNAPDAA